MKKAFTLIELLIVVLIIAILAAIAVPNFLEFQTRAKVSRTMSDMRSIATAIEAYYVDNNDYMPGIGEGAELGLWTRSSIGDDANPIYARLTTPIAYMSTIPLDVFAENRTFVDPSSVRLAKQFFYESTDFSGNNVGGFGGTVNYSDMKDRGFEWLMFTRGPLGEGQAPFPQEMVGTDDLARSVQEIYDPTNGTVSSGYVMRTSKGVYPN